MNNIKKVNYSVVRLTHESNEEDYAIQRVRQHWLTGEPEPVYLKRSDDWWIWTRNVNRASTWPTPELAKEELDWFVRVSCRKVAKVKVQEMVI